MLRQINLCRKMSHLLLPIANNQRWLSTIVKSYPSYVERQADIQVETSSYEETVSIDQDSKVNVRRPSTFTNLTVNYVDTNPIGDKNQSIVLLIHGYPGNHSVMRSLIEQFQRRNFRCIVPDMPCQLVTIDNSLV